MQTEFEHAAVTDGALARAAADGDRAAFEHIVRRYTQPLMEFASARTGSLPDAEDIVQETFMRAYMHIAAFDADYLLKSWLFTIAYRLIVSNWRRKKALCLDDCTEPCAAPKPADPDHGWIWQAARELGTASYTALWLRYRQDMAIPEISRIMKKSDVSVRVLLHRSRRRLAKKMRDIPHAHNLHFRPQIPQSERNA